VIGRFRRNHDHWTTLPEKEAGQLNDTHLAIAELMRILVDESHFGWDEAWGPYTVDACLHKAQFVTEGSREMACDVVSNYTAQVPDHLRNQSPAACENDRETRGTLDLIFSDHFSREERDNSEPLRAVLLRGRGYYKQLPDLRSYVEVHGHVEGLYRDPGAWTHTSILSVASLGKFSSDRTIAEYPADIWNVNPCPVS